MLKAYFSLSIYKQSLHHITISGGVADRMRKSIGGEPADNVRNDSREGGFRPSIGRNTGPVRAQLKFECRARKNVGANNEKLRFK